MQNPWRTGFGLIFLAFWLAAGCGAPRPTNAPGPIAPSGMPAEKPATEGALPAPPAVPTTKEPFAVIIGGTGARKGLAFYAEEFGLYEKYGLEVTIQRIGGGGPANAALVGGQADVSASSGPGPAESRLQGSDLVYIANISPLGDQYLMVRPELVSVEQLRGGKAAVTSFGGGFYTIMKTFILPRYGLDRGPEPVTILAAGDTPTALEGVRTGAFDMALASSDQMLAISGLKPLLTPEDLRIPWIEGFVASENRVRERRPAFIRFLKAQIETIAIIKKDPGRTTAAMRKWFRSEDEGLMGKYQQLLAQALSPVPVIGAREVEAMLLMSESEAARSAPPEVFFDNSLLEEIERSGLANRLR